MNYVRSDITGTHVPFIVHGCNTQGVFNKGVAKAIRQAFPFAYKAYIEQYRIKRPGQAIIAVDPDSTLVIGNLLTQKTYGNYGVHAEPELIRSSLLDFIFQTRATVIASPKIGCNLGGLVWSDVEPIFLEIEDRLGVDFIIYYK